MRKEITLAEYPMPDTLPIENRLLASLIMDSSSMSMAIDNVRVEFFSAKETRKVWRVLCEMHQNHETINFATILPRIDRNYYIHNLAVVDTDYSFKAISDLCIALTEAYVKREAYASAMSIIQASSEGAEATTITGLYERFSRNLTRLGDGVFKNTIDLANDLAADIQSGVLMKMPTGFPSVDMYTSGGMGYGELCILAARPSVGKTTIAMQIAHHVSKQGRVMVFSLEMTGKQLTKRLLQSTGLISNYEIYSHQVDWGRYDTAVKIVANENLIINDKPITHIQEIRQKLLMQHQTSPLSLVVIDYLQLVRGANPKLSKADQVGEITSQLKQLALECGIPFLVLSQLNRSGVAEGRSPQLTDLRDSGSIEQDADMVIMLEQAKTETGMAIERAIDLWIRKNRDGNKNLDNSIRLYGNRNYTNFSETQDL